MMRKEDEWTSLEKIAHTLCAEAVDFAQLRDAVQAYRSLLTKLVAMDTEDISLKEDIHLSSGKAIGTTWAAFCVDDLLRTKRFVKGIYEAACSI